MNEKKALFEVKNLTKTFESQGRLLRAVNDISLTIYSKEILGLVGESGCGKTVFSRMLTFLYTPTSGDIFFEGKNLIKAKPKELRRLRQNMQYIFQDPYASLNPRMTAGEIIVEPLKIHRIMSSKEQESYVLQLLKYVGLPPDATFRFPHEFSGGQRQRIGIARALALNPRFIVCDEPTAALDVSIQAQIINLLKELQEKFGLTYLFISHDLALVKYLSTRIVVMYLGKIMEIASRKDLYKKAFHPYTQALLSSIPIPNPIAEKKRHPILLKGEVPSPMNFPKGCVFSSRCPKVMPICKQKTPKLQKISSDHHVACHLFPSS